MLGEKAPQAGNARGAVLSVDGGQVEIDVAFMIEPIRQGAVYRVQPRLPLLVLQGDEVQRAIRHPVRFGRTQVVLILECDQINRLFVAMCRRPRRVFASFRPHRPRILIDSDRRSRIGLIRHCGRARVAVVVVVRRVGVAAAVAVAVAVAVIGVTVIWIAVIVIIGPVRIWIESEAEAEEITIAAIEPAAEATV